MIKASRMYRMPEKQTGHGMVSNCAWTCFCYQYANHLPCRLLCIKLKYDFFTTFRFVSFHFIIFVLAEFFYMPRRFISILLPLHLCKLPFIWRISLETKMSPSISQMLVSLGTLFILTIKIL